MRTRPVDRNRTGGWPAACLLAALAAAQTAPARAADDAPVIVQHALEPGLALELATAVQSACRARDFQVSVAVVDRGGLPQVVLRDQLAGNFTFDVALAKARTAAGFRQPTLDLAQGLPARTELQLLHHVDGVLMIGGGVPIEVAGAVVGAVAVSGAPTPQDDHACASAGLEAVADRLLF